MKDSAVKFKDVRYCYGDVCAVHNASFSINEGSLTAFIGPNGGGKTTYLRAAAVDLIFAVTGCPVFAIFLP